MNAPTRMQRGLTLLELLVAVAIMAMSLALLYRVMGGGARAVGKLDATQRAVVLAQSLMALRDTAFRDPTSFFRAYAELSDDEAVQQANTVWDGINKPNLIENIEPTRERATAILRKGSDHVISEVRIRRI